MKDPIIIPNTVGAWPVVLLGLALVVFSPFDAVPDLLAVAEGGVEVRLAVALGAIGFAMMAAGKLTTMLAFETGAVRIYFERFPVRKIHWIRIEEHLPHPRLRGVQDYLGAGSAVAGQARLLVTIKPRTQDKPIYFGLLMSTADAAALRERLGRLYGDKIVSGPAGEPVRLTDAQADHIWLRNNVVLVFGLLLLALAVCNL